MTIPAYYSKWYPMFSTQCFGYSDFHIHFIRLFDLFSKFMYDHSYEMGIPS